MDEPINSFSKFLRQKFPGRKVLKIPIHAGFTCPNRDGTISSDGCIFCDRYAAGPIHSFSWPIERQIESYIRNHPGCKYIAYFQSFSNTHGPVEELKRRCGIVFQYDSIVGLFIGTRPDSISPPVYSLLEEMKRRIYLSVELGLQSVHQRSLALLNRNHTYAQFLHTFRELEARGIDVIVHLIVGIPGESPGDMLQTVQAMNELRPAGIKFHLFHILRDTELHSRHERSPLSLLSLEEYTDIIVELLEHLHPGIVVHRLTAEREKEIFVAPQWAMDKQAVLHSIRMKMKEKRSFQGRCLRPC